MDRFTASELNPNTEPDWASFADNVQQQRMSQSGPQQKRWFGVVLMLLGLVALAWAAWHFTVRPHLIAQDTPAATTSSASRCLAARVYDSVWYHR
jgi:hypothetical protein